MSDRSTYNFDVAFSAIRIRNTRSRHEDTLWIKITVSVDGTVIGTTDWDGTGGRDKNNGYFDGLRNAGNAIIGVTTGPISDNSVVKVTFLVLNSGHTPNEDAYSRALGSIADAASSYGSIWGYAIAVVADVASVLVGADCDGPVAADRLTVTGKEIAEKIAQEESKTGRAYYNWKNFTAYIGPDSAHGCGSNSNYDAIIQFTRH